jgi:hypothetical protein
MGPSNRDHVAFKQKPTYRARPGDWVAGAGHARRKAAGRFLHELSSYRRRIQELYGVAPITWLLAFRNDFRRIQGDETVAVLRDFLRYGDPDLRHIAVWLLSQCADRFRLRGITDYRDDPSPQVRKHVAKALRRLEAWYLLDEMARLDRDNKTIQWFARAPNNYRPFDERLASFVRTLDDSYADEAIAPSRMPFWAFERSWERTPPKTVLYIRRMLRRIRHWVRWGVN